MLKTTKAPHSPPNFARQRMKKTAKVKLSWLVGWLRKDFRIGNRIEIRIEIWKEAHGSFNLLLILAVPPKFLRHFMIT